MDPNDVFCQPQKLEFRARNDVRVELTAFPFASNLSVVLKTATDTCRPMKKKSQNITTPNPDINSPICPLPGRQLVLFGFVSLQSCFGLLPLAPSTDQTSAVYLLQPFDGSALDFFLMGKLSRDSLYMKMEKPDDMHSFHSRS